MGAIMTIENISDMPGISRDWLSGPAVRGEIQGTGSWRDRRMATASATRRCRPCAGTGGTNPGRLPGRGPWTRVDPRHEGGERGRQLAGGVPAVRDFADGPVHEQAALPVRHHHGVVLLVQHRIRRADVLP